MTRNRLAALALTALLVVLLAGCGNSGPDYSQYCAVAKRYQGIFADDGTGLNLVTNVAKLKLIAAQSPDDLKDEWQTFLGAVEGLDSAVKSVGLKPTDFVNGKTPAGTPASSVETVIEAANRLSQPDVVDAANGIEQEAKDVCQLQFGL